MLRQKPWYLVTYISEWKQFHNSAGSKTQEKKLRCSDDCFGSINELLRHMTLQVKCHMQTSCGQNHSENYYIFSYQIHKRESRHKNKQWRSKWVEKEIKLFNISIFIKEYWTIHFPPQPRNDWWQLNIEQLYEMYPLFRVYLVTKQFNIHKRNWKNHKYWVVFHLKRVNLGTSKHH